MELVENAINHGSVIRADRLFREQGTHELLLSIAGDLAGGQNLLCYLSHRRVSV